MKIEKIMASDLKEGDVIVNIGKITKILAKNKVVTVLVGEKRGYFSALDYVQIEKN
ncbi:hypothetical protein NIES4101_53190 [Calothrix sp. NIES-4101]|nr:hypothetical protein NIES4101_53190 [Calothrix sp. NIES-4101]